LENSSFRSPPDFGVVLGKFGNSPDVGITVTYPAYCGSSSSISAWTFPKPVNRFETFMAQLMAEKALSGKGWEFELVVGRLLGRAMMLLRDRELVERTSRAGRG